MKLAILIVTIIAVLVVTDAQIQVRPKKPTVFSPERLNYATEIRGRRSADTNVNAGIDINKGKPTWNAGVDHTIYKTKNGKIGVQAGVGGPFGRRPEAQIYVGGQWNFPG